MRRSARAARWSAIAVRVAARPERSTATGRSQASSSATVPRLSACSIPPELVSNWAFTC
ncbi:hypothetical protein ACFQ0T_01330 [Kitasatospora gansuensis]